MPDKNELCSMPILRGYYTHPSMGSSLARKHQMEVNSKVIHELDNKYRQRLLFLARRMIGNAETAEEVVQDAFHIINNKLSDFRGDSDI
ncbi:MAG TPA: sigma-70 family RNA polymerase sigma factor, partial [Candidatus Marinimicrobia bacterium]|nr:sigma-70 family RNA polymerase sigma factor [Candidatus Neomarinimicrobiota bacterium]